MIDFSRFWVQVVAAKAVVIARTPQLHSAFGQGAMASAEGVSSGCYSLLAGAAPGLLQAMLCRSDLPALPPLIPRCDPLTSKILPSTPPMNAGKKPQPFPPPPQPHTLYLASQTPKLPSAT